LETKEEQREQARRDRELRESLERSKAQRKRRLAMVGGALAAAAVVVVVAILISSSTSDTPGGSPKGKASGSGKAASLMSDIPQKGNVLGSPDAKVTLQEFADLQCPHCRDFTTQVYPTIVERYVRTGKVKIVFRNFPILGQDSVRAAFTAESAAKQDKMFDFNDVFYANQGPEESGYVTDAFLRKVGRGVPGLDVDKLLAQRKDPAITTTLRQVQKDAAANGIDGTPGFLLQVGAGKPQALSLDPTDLAGFTSALDQALASAGT
jgi:protein-disulfide isomerase